MDGNLLLAAFGLGKRPELVAIVGGGGKTSLMFALARAWPGRVITTTTTRIFAAQMSLSPGVVRLGDWETDLEAIIAQVQLHLERFGQCLIVGQLGEGSNVGKALGVSPELPGRLLGQAGIDLVLVEADGSRMKPIKAPADHEPVIPAETTLVVPVVGIDALDGSLDEVTHRPERVRELIVNSQRSIANCQRRLSSPLTIDH